MSSMMDKFYKYLSNQSLSNITSIQFIAAIVFLVFFSKLKCWSCHLQIIVVQIPSDHRGPDSSVCPARPCMTRPWSASLSSSPSPTFLPVLSPPLPSSLSTHVPLSHHMCPSFHVKHILFTSSPEKSYVLFIFTGDILCYVFLEDFADIVSSPHPLLARFSSSINTSVLHLANCILTICCYPLTVSHLRGGLFLYSLSPDSGAAHGRVCRHKNKRRC